jgi:tetratricopeptide (TPR) repeat protein
LQRGVVLAMKERFAEAADEFRASAQLSPEAGLPHVALGLALMQMEKVAEAIEVLRRQSAKIVDRESRIEDRRSKIEKDSNLDPLSSILYARSSHDAYVFLFLGEALNRFGIAPGSEGEKEAIAALEKSIQLDPRLPQARALLGKLLLRRGEIDRAARELEKAVELDPEDLAATYQLAQALQRKGQTARAKQLFEKVEKAKTEEPPSAQRTLLRIIKAQSQ